MDIGHIDGITGLTGQKARPPISVFSGYQYGYSAFVFSTTFIHFLTSNQSVVELNDIREVIKRSPYSPSQFAILVLPDEL